MDVLKTAYLANHNPVFGVYGDSGQMEPGLIGLNSNYSTSMCRPAEPSIVPCESSRGKALSRIKGSVEREWSGWKRLIVIFASRHGLHSFEIADGLNGEITQHFSTRISALTVMIRCLVTGEGEDHVMPARGMPTI